MGTDDDTLRQIHELQWHREHLEHLYGRKVSLQEASEDWCYSLAKKYREKHPFEEE